MKRLFITIFLISLMFNLFSEISVKSFRKLENDMTARVDAPKIDQNGDVCAIIKIVTTQTGFVWEPDGLGIISSDWKNGEYWLYVPYGAKHLTIKHDKLGILRDYMYPLPIEKACVYEMVLTTGKVITTVDETIESQWLVINTEPTDAAVYIENEFVKTGTYQNKIKPGSYSYRVEAPLYHSEAGKVEVTDTKKEISVKLNPAFGYVTVNTEPEKDAKVIIDGKNLTQNTPCKSEALASGEHTVQVLKEMYQPSTQKITVTDGQTTLVNLVMQPNFAELTITAPEATIYVNNQRKTNGTWNGRLPAGVYSIEARREKYRSAKQDIDLTIGDVKNINLQPTPIYGSLDIMTTPAGATITIDGKEYGTTPNTVNRLLIGDYTVQLTKSDYATLNKTVSITDGKSLELTEILENGRVVTINSTPAEASLYIDGIASGKTTFKGNLTFGNHILRIENDGKKTEKTVSITQTGGQTNFTLSFGLKTFNETLNGVSFEMIAVKGGTFQMGSNNGGSNEKPIHSVTLSDFAIGKTEVTQAIWQAVMGNNPSCFKGDNLPVESISWNDAQRFIEALNSKTGKTYRLPTEAEWEYAARGGNKSNGYEYAGSNTLADVGWCADNSGDETHAVAGKQPNELGMYDMSGNVTEWCADWYGAYPDGPQTNPNGPSSGSSRVTRGGGLTYNDRGCSSASRHETAQFYTQCGIGFRVVFVP